MCIVAMLYKNIDTVLTSRHRSGQQDVLTGRVPWLHPDKKKKKKKTSIIAFSSHSLSDVVRDAVMHHHKSVMASTYQKQGF